MRGMFLEFEDTHSSVIAHALEELTIQQQLEDDWIDFEEVRERVAEILSDTRGIPTAYVLAHLEQVCGAPAFKSPAQRKWYFATQQRGDAEGGPVESKGHRWQDVLQQAKDAIALQPEITGPELAGMIDVSPPLTPKEEERVQKLVSPERLKRLVKSPRAVPIEERTPETEELVTEEWPDIQREKEEKKEKELLRSKRKRNKPMQTKLGPSQIPPFSPPGMPYVGASKGTQKQYFLDKCPKIADGDNWRAFQHAVRLSRSGVDDGDVKVTLCDEYPEVDPQEILQAAKGYIKEGSKDPYVHGRTQVQELVREGSVVPALAAEYSNLQWQDVDPRFLQGFREGLPFEALRLIRRKSPDRMF